PTAANSFRVSTVDDQAATPAEQRICRLFEDVLGVTGVRPDDSFFAIGGDSIVALRLRTAALAAGVAVELADIYALQTPRAIAAMRTAVSRAVAKHEMLRTSFDFTRYSEPLQQVHATAHLPLTHADLRHLDENAQQAELDAWCEREKQTPYDWATPPLVRFAV